MRILSAGIQRRERTLQDQAERASTQVAQIAFAHCKQVRSLKMNVPFDGGALASEQSEDGQCQGALTGTTLANQSDDFAARDFERARA